MSNAKKRLDAALKNTDELPDHWFGNEKASYEDLPSLRRHRRVRKNIFIEEAIVNELEEFCKKNRVSFTDIANDILRSFVARQKKSKA
jgi:hypothetical protein